VRHAFSERHTVRINRGNFTLARLTLIDVVGRNGRSIPSAPRLANPRNVNDRLCSEQYSTLLEQVYSASSSPTVAHRCEASNFRASSANASKPNATAHTLGGDGGLTVAVSGNTDVAMRRHSGGLMTEPPERRDKALEQHVHRSVLCHHVRVLNRRRTLGVVASD